MKQFVYAPYLIRFIAFMLDFFCFTAIYFFMIEPMILKVESFSQISFQIILFTIMNIFFVLALSLLERSRLQSTPGKLLFRVRVVTLEGKRCTFKQLLIRNSIKVFTAIYLFIIFFHFESINNYLIAAVLLSISTNPVWHNFMTITAREKHLHQLVHDEVAKTIVIR